MNQHEPTIHKSVYFGDMPYSHLGVATSATKSTKFPPWQHPSGESHTQTSPKYWKYHLMQAMETKSPDQDGTHFPRPKTDQQQESPGGTSGKASEKWTIEFDDSPGKNCDSHSKWLVHQRVSFNYIFRLNHPL